MQRCWMLLSISSICKVCHCGQRRHAAQESTVGQLWRGHLVQGPAWCLTEGCHRSELVGRPELLLLQPAAPPWLPEKPPANIVCFQWLARCLRKIPLLVGVRDSMPWMMSRVDQEQNDLMPL